MITTDIATDQNGNFIWENFDFRSTNASGAEWVAQKLQAKIKMVLGEYFLDVTKGIDWFGSILEKNNNPDLGWALIKQEILDTQYVEELLTFTGVVNSSLRTAKLNFTVRIKTGEIVPVEVIV